MTSNTTDSTNILFGEITIKPRQTGRPYYLASDRVYHKATFEELIEEKNPGISFDLLPPEAKEKAREKLKAFDDIVKPSPDQKQEHDSFESDLQEFKFWYYDQYLPNIGVSDADKLK